MKARILIVEDSITQAMKLKFLLEDNQYETVIAGNGKKGIEMLRDLEADLIISDVTMPVMDGFEMCLIIKQDSSLKHMPVLLLTDLSDPEDIIRGLNVNADGYVTKPFEDQFLLSKIEFLLNSGSGQKVNNIIEEEGIEIQFAGKKHVIHASRKQVLNLLLSTYDNSIAQNRELRKKQVELNNLNEQLKKNMKKLSASEEQFRNLILTIPDIVYRIDKKGNFTFVNDAIRKLGYKRTELIGKHFSNIIYPPDLDSISRDRVLEKYPKDMKQNRQPKLFDERRTGKRITTGLEVRLRSKHGKLLRPGMINTIGHETLFVEVNSSGFYGLNPNSEEKELIGTVGVIRDISERKKAEEAIERERLFLQTVIDSVPLPIFFKDIHGKYKLCNKYYFEFFNKDKDKVISKSLFDFLPIELAEEFHFQDQLFLNGKMKKQIYETKVIDSIGSEHIVVINKAKVFKPDNTLDGILGVIIDITDRKEAEEEIQEARKAAELLARKADEANRSKSDFLANMSHEIRTPLNAVLGLNELALNTELTSKQRDYLVKISSSAKSLLGIINDILDFSKIEAKRLDLESIEFSIDKVLENLSSIVGLKANLKGIELIFHTNHDVPDLLIGDPLRFGQILTNLANNAVKFTDMGKIVISLSIVKKGTDYIILECSVRDTGIGLTDMQKSMLFQPFTQADSSTTRKYGGTGLGLTICKRLIEMMDGEISVESTYGSGSAFIFTAKFGLPDNEFGRKKIVTSINKDFENINKEKLKNAYVLLVEDNLINQQVASEIMQQAGINVIIAGNGREAVDIISNRMDSVYGGKSGEIKDEFNIMFDAILMDIQMPVMDGYAAAKEITKIVDSFKKKTNQEIYLPVIAMTAYAMSGDREKSIEAGMIDYISKPIDTDQFFTVLLNRIDITKIDKFISLPDNESKIHKAHEPEKKPEFPDELPGINIKKAINRLEGNTKLFKSIIKEFYNSNLATLSNIKEAISSDDMEKVHIIAHSLKGVSGNISAKELFKVSSSLELCAYKKNKEESMAILDQFEAALNLVLDSISKILPSDEKTININDNKQIDTSQAKQLLLKIKKNLDDNDLDANTSLNSLKSILNSTKFQEDINLLEEYVNNLDYMNAYDPLQKIADLLRVKL